jgi:hypothetical protein
MRTVPSEHCPAMLSEMPQKKKIGCEPCLTVRASASSACWASPADGTTQQSSAAHTDGTTQQSQPHTHSNHQRMHSAVTSRQAKCVPMSQTSASAHMCGCRWACHPDPFLTQCVPVWPVARVQAAIAMHKARTHQQVHAHARTSGITLEHSPSWSARMFQEQTWPQSDDTKPCMRYT